MGWGAGERAVGIRLSRYRVGECGGRICGGDEAWGDGVDRRGLPQVPGDQAQGAPVVGAQSMVQGMDQQAQLNHGQ